MSSIIQLRHCDKPKAKRPYQPHFWLLIACISIILLVPFSAVAQSPEPGCDAPEPVCQAKSSVYKIASFDPFASAIRLGPKLLVTNRHVLADQMKAEVILSPARTIKARVLPSGFVGDLVLLETETELPGVKTPPETVTVAEATPPFRVIGADLGQDRVRVYAPGTLLIGPEPGYPMSRLHSDAFGQPGNSGGALVDAKGRLLGIMTSGGQGWVEAIPATRLPELLDTQGPEHAQATKNLGLAYRACIDGLDAAYRNPSALAGEAGVALAETCKATNNRQYLDLVGQSLGQARQLGLSEEVLDKALSLDPNGPNTLLSMAITLHIQRKYDREIPIIRKLLPIMPKDPQVLRLGIQAGKFGNDRALAEESYSLLAKHHPNLAPLARSFLDGLPPPAAPGR